ncbi:NEDD8 ultimate buster 1-like isoform X2 [Orbicella faveolata]|uniref:NEDD8 ultimate buster 1-like isoform X2 n=1 Tax=Orbicella faveolata TaxID=48498 RepID=UPI0009E23DBE|nr:NEDD8 ultimate buster 1-like isoform X2 [Orbicella faveolata]
MAEKTPHFNAILSRVRGKLRSENVKLWLPPYTSSNDQPGYYPEELINRYSAELNASAEEISEAMEQLRVHAVTKLQTEQRFTNSGIATIKVHVTGSIPLGINSSLSKETGLDPEKMKLICKGHVIEDDKSLESQNVKNNAQIMVLLLSQSSAETQRLQNEEDETKASVSRTRQAAEALSNRKDNFKDDRFFLEISDQEGKPVKLPDSERKALTLALTLHEKGRTVLNKRNYAEALLLLLEAEKEFSHCRAQILSAVDNYGILCLDIVWCYFWLKSIVDLPNAEEKLQKCKECFQRSYGQNLERLTSVRGGSGGELALFVRLHVLEAVCAYHKGDVFSTANCLDKAELVKGKLHIDQDQLNQLLIMGFSESEARLGLRACQGDTTSAVDYITQKRQEKKERREKEKKDRTRKKLERKLGKTGTGEWVNVDAYNSLVEMGFSKHMAAASLRQANNDINNALQTLQDHPGLLSIPDISSRSAFSDAQISDEHVAQVMSLGFAADSSREALKRCHGDVQQAINLLESCGGVLSSLQQLAQGSATESNSKDEEDPDVEEAVRELVPDLATEDDEAHLNLSLEEESSIIAEYRTLLLSAGYDTNSASLKP